MGRSYLCCMSILHQRSTAKIAINRSWKSYSTIRKETKIPEGSWGILFRTPQCSRFLPEHVCMCVCARARAHAQWALCHNFPLTNSFQHQKMTRQLNFRGFIARQLQDYRALFQEKNSYQKTEPCSNQNSKR